MVDNVVSFPRSASVVRPIAHFIRLGETGAKALQDLRAAGRLPAERVVVDASRYKQQKALIDGLREGGTELVLDTKCAELGALGRHAGNVSRAPWADGKGDGPLDPSHFERARRDRILSRIAAFAVQHNFDAVLAPNHWIDDPNYTDWFALDLECVRDLRAALDREGGTRIGIDYPLIVSHVKLGDGADRKRLFEPLRDLPIDNIWVRASGLSHDSGAHPLQRHILALRDLHRIGRPIVADYLGGHAALTLLGFGAVAGVAHGVGEAESFGTTNWKSEPVQKDDGETRRGGRGNRAPIPGTNYSVNIRELAVLESARGGRKLCACPDRRCCPHGIDDVRRSSRDHRIFQAFDGVQRMGDVPDAHRAGHLLSKVLEPAVRQADQVAKLKPKLEVAREHEVDVEKLMRRMSDNARGLRRTYEGMRNAAENQGRDVSRSEPIQPRQAQTNMFARRLD